MAEDEEEDVEVGARPDSTVEEEVDVDRQGSMAEEDRGGVHRDSKVEVVVRLDSMAAVAEGVHPDWCRSDPMAEVGQVEGEGHWDPMAEEGQ
jgi:hypothetical protein